MGIRLVIDGNSVYEIDEDCQKGRPKSGGPVRRSLRPRATGNAA